MVLDKDSCLMHSCLGCHGDDFPRSQRRKDVGVQEREKDRCFVTPDDDSAGLSGTVQEMTPKRSSVWRLFIVTSEPAGHDPECTAHENKVETLEKQRAPSACLSCDLCSFRPTNGNICASF